MKKIFMILLSVVMVMSVCACGNKESVDNTFAQWQEQYDLGNRYMLDGNYDEAIIAFQAAIKIDDKNVDAWLGLADAYIGKGDYDSAKSTIIDALSFIEDQRLADKLNEIEKLINSSVTSETTVTTKEGEIKPLMLQLFMDGMAENIVRFEDMQPLGHTIGVMTLDEWQSVLSANGFKYLKQEDMGGYIYLTGTSDIMGHVLLQKSRKDTHVSMISPDFDYDGYPIGTRDILNNDSLGEIFAKLGFSNSDKIEKYLTSLAVQTADTDDFNVEQLLNTQEWELHDLYEQITGEKDFFIDIDPHGSIISKGEYILRSFDLRIEWHDNIKDSSSPSYKLILSFRYNENDARFNFDNARYQIYVPRN